MPDPAFAKRALGGGPAPVSLWSHELGPGATLHVPKHRALELFVVVLSGELELQPLDVAAPVPLFSWSALFASGAGLSLHAKQRALVVLALASAEGSIARAIALSPSEWERRPKALRITSFEDQPELDFARGKAHARIAFGAHDPEGLRPAASLTLLYSEPDTGVPPNVHEHEWEHLAILDGEGIMLLGDEHLVLGPGAVYQVPEKVEHGFTPNGNRSLLAIQLFSPPGPEQRFVALANSAEEPKPPESPRAPGPR